jgi:hypothetical protein
MSAIIEIAVQTICARFSAVRRMETRDFIDEEDIRM